MNHVVKKIIEGLIGTIVIIILLRLLFVPTYAFIHSRNEFIMIMLMIPETVLSVFVAYKVVRYIHKYL